MKKQLLTGLLLLSAASLLASCGENQDSGTSSERVKSVALLLFNDEEGKVGPSGVNFNLLFKANSEIPYVSLKEGFAFLNVIKAAHYSEKNNDKHYFRFRADGNKLVAYDEEGATATFDPAEQTITYDQFETFTSLAKDAKNLPLGLFNASPLKKAIKVVDSKFEKGNSFVVDLKGYSHIDLYSRNGELYLPLMTFNDFFYDVYEHVTLAYNYKDIYLAPSDSFITQDEDGEPSLTPLGEAFYDVSSRATIGEDIQTFHLQEAAINFDYLYGLKKDKGYTSFASFIEDKGFKGDFLNSDTKRADAGLRYVLTHLNDGHTAMGLTSCFYPLGSGLNDKTRMNPERDAWEKYGEELAAARKKSSTSVGNYLDEENQLFYITFDHFTQINENVLYAYDPAMPAQKIYADTALQFHDAYSYLASAENKGKVKTVVVDMVTNEGGSADALTYATSTLVGKVNTIVQNPFTGAINRTTYAADLNLDGAIDEKDVSLADLGYNIVFLNSKASFSSGNALPFFAKAGNPSKVMTIGETTGGGACVVRPCVSALGSSYSVSGPMNIMTEKDGKLTNVDAGIPAEHAVAKDKFFDRSYIASQLKEWVK